MELEIRSKRDNPPLGRTEVEFTVTHDGEPTPSREALRDALAKALNSPKDTVVVDSLRSTFGKGQSAGYAKVYTSLELAKKYERPHILVRNKLAEKAAKKSQAKPAAGAGGAAAKPAKKEAK